MPRREKGAQKVTSKLKNTRTPVCVAAPLAVAKRRGDLSAADDEWTKHGVRTQWTLLRHTSNEALPQAATWAALETATPSEPSRRGRRHALSRTCDSHTTQMDAPTEERQTWGPGRHTGGCRGGGGGRGQGRESGTCRSNGSWPSERGAGKELPGAQGFRPQ